MLGEKDGLLWRLGMRITTGLRCDWIFYFTGELVHNSPAGGLVYTLCSNVVGFRIICVYTLGDICISAPQTYAYSSTAVFSFAEVCLAVVLV